MSEVLLFFACVFFVVAVTTAFEYCRHIVKVKREYEKAKDVFDDIILSFSRELKRAFDVLESISYKADVASSKSSDALKRAENLEVKVGALEKKVSIVPEEWEKVQVRLDELEKKNREIVASHETLTTRISTLEETTKKLSFVPPEANVETVIPIKKEKALASLTETELAVLKMLTTEGPKTASEIKERIKLSREHTARLMKKLYEDGYLERDSSKIPFKYSIKKEMENILNKTEVDTA